MATTLGFSYGEVGQPGYDQPPGSNTGNSVCISISSLNSPNTALPNTTPLEFGTNWNNSDDWVRGIIRFTGVTNAIKPGNTVTNAYFILTSDGFGSAAPGYSVAAYRLLRNDYRPDQATWYVYKGTTGWTSPGANGAGDRASTWTANTLIGNAVNGSTYYWGINTHSANMIADVQAAIDGQYDPAWIGERSDGWGPQGRTFFNETFGTFAGGADVPILWVTYQTSAGGAVTTKFYVNHFWY
jgi:hypothetical protein